MRAEALERELEAEAVELDLARSSNRTIMSVTLAEALGVRTGGRAAAMVFHVGAQR